MKKFDENNNKNTNDLNNQEEKNTIEQEQDTTSQEKDTANDMLENMTEDTDNVDDTTAVDASVANNKNNNKNNSIFYKIIRNRSFRYGSNSIILIAAVCAIAVFLNVLLGFTNLKWDLTPNKLYSIGDETKSILEGIDKEVTIYGLFDDTKVGSNEFVKLLEQYERYPNITVKYIDPDKNPGILKEIDPQGILSDISKNTFIVKSGNKLKGLDSYDLYSTQFDQSTFNIYKTGSIAEQSFTGAIKYVTAEYTPTIYFTTGHDEKDIDYDFSILKQQLINNNFDVKPINLVTEEKVPEDASVLVIASPQKDLTQSERDKMEEYLKNGGKAIFMFDYLEMDPQFPQFESILMEYNVSLNYDKVKENDERRHLPQDQYVVLMDVKGGNVIDDGYSILLADSRSLNILKNDKEWISVTPLAQTSSLAVGERVDKTKGEDTEGPLNVAVAVEHKGWSKISKIAVLGNSNFLEDRSRDFFGPYYNNGVIFFLDTVNWMQDQKNEVTIAPKYYQQQFLDITAQQATYMGILVVIVLPLAILAVGLVVYLRRRHL